MYGKATRCSIDIQYYFNLWIELVNISSLKKYKVHFQQFLVNLSKVVGIVLIFFQNVIGFSQNLSRMEKMIIIYLASKI